jgi:signal transduction histidine kinase
VTALGKFVRTTTFKLTIVYLTVFALFAAFLLAYFALNTRRLFTEQITATVEAEVNGITEQYRSGGIRRLVQVIESRSSQPGSSLYLVTTPEGQGLAGNVGYLPMGTLESNGWSETEYRRLDDPASEHHALIRVFQLPGGFRMLVGRDLDDREKVHNIVIHAGRWSVALVVILGLAGGFFVTRRALRRVDAMTETTRTIVEGNLSERLHVAGTGDELDRLAENLNAMLDRIEALMRGLTEVSDNIAHDLKTPLTRLRNRAEEALRVAKTDTDYRAALESTIDESDDLMRTFNALLMIARAESGHAREDMEDFDAAEVARGIGELYEPLADEKGLSLKIEAPAPIMIHGQRELVSQALSNLVDNAIKYAVPDGKEGAIVVTADAEPECVLLSVADNGPGIAEADRARVVERFVRLETSRSEPGSGLGLSLVSAVARLHGGELILRDNNPGLKAIIALPRGGPVQSSV